LIFTSIPRSGCGADNSEKLGALALRLQLSTLSALLLRYPPAVIQNGANGSSEIASDSYILIQDHENFKQKCKVFCISTSQSVARRAIHLRVARFV